MASTDIDGTKLMIIGEGQPLTLIMGDRSYQGTLRLRVDGFQENWFIEMPRVSGSEVYEIEIHKRERAPETSTGEIVKLMDDIHQITKPKDGF